MSRKSIIIHFIIITLLSISHSAYTQQLISAGPRLGLHLSDFSGKHATNNHVKPGLQAGAYVTFSRQRHLAITTEFNFTNKGTRFGSSDSLASGTQHVNYFEIPVLVSYFFFEGSSRRPVLYAGPAFGYLINASQKVNGVKKISNTKDFVSSDLSIIIGAGYSFRFERHWFNTSLRYSHSLSEIYTSTSTNKDNISNQVITLSISMGLGLGKK